MIPQYLKFVQHFDLSEAGVVSSLPVIFQTCVAVLGSPLTDFISNMDKWSWTRIRKSLTFIGLLPSVILISTITVLGCNSSSVIIVLCLAYRFTGIASIQRVPALITVSPRLSDTLHGVVDALYSCGGFFVPIMCSAMVQGHEYEISYWSRVWYTCSAFVGVWGLTYI